MVMITQRADGNWERDTCTSDFVTERVGGGGEVVLLFEEDLIQPSPQSIFNERGFVTLRHASQPGKNVWENQDLKMGGEGKTHWEMEDIFGQDGREK